MALMAEYMFNWLPVRDVIAVVLFAVSLLLLAEVKKTRKAGQLDAWMVGISLWMVGMIFDALRRVDGWGALRIAERLFQLAGSIAVAYAAYGSHRRMKSNVFLVKGYVEDA